MVNTPASQRFRGGDLTQMRETARVLREDGLDVSECFDIEPDTRGFDIAHVFNLRTIDVTARQVASLRSSGIPVVLSPIYLDPSTALWGTRVMEMIFSQERTPTELESLLAQFRRRELEIKRADGATWTASRRNRPRSNYDEAQRRIVAQVDRLLPNSYMEMDRLAKTLAVSGKPFSVIPYAAEAEVFAEADPQPFIDRYGIENFVIEVGRIELSKNQLMLALAMRDLDVPLVLVGGHLQERYLEWCRRYGPRQLVILDHISHDELRSAYAAARVHALPSWIETCGLVTMEAALADCEVVVSIAGYELEFYQDLALYCDPADSDSIRTQVEHALSAFGTEAAQRRRQALRERLRRHYTWQHAAAATRTAYEQVLAS